MEVQWPESFQRMLDRYTAAAEQGKEYETNVLTLILAALNGLRELDAEPSEESFTFKVVRQCRKRTVWRVSHPYIDGLAVRIIAWFPPEENDTVVVALFSGEKANMGDVFYNSVEQRAEPCIQAWYREREAKEEDGRS
jgi:hypothetical protein